MDEIITRCIAIIARSKNISPETITADTTFEQLNMDSLDKINVSFDVEDSFNIQIPDDSIGSLRSVRDMADGILRLQQQKLSGDSPTEVSL